MTTPEESITIKVDGFEYTLYPKRLSGRDSVDVRKETGRSLRSLMEDAGNDPDLDVVAAIVWLARRQSGESALTFSMVLDGITYDSNIEATAAATDPEPDSPEA